MEQRKLTKMYIVNTFKLSVMKEKELDSLLWN